MKGMNLFLMNTRIALIGIMVESLDKTEQINRLLHEFSQYIIGRMGVPCRDRELYMISVVIDAPKDKISALSGKLGMIEGVSSKAIYSREKNADEA